MNTLNQTLTAVLNLLVGLFDIILGVIAAIETWLRGQLAHLGVAPPVQTVILLAAALLMLLAALRLFGGALRLLLVLLLVLWALHALLPALHMTPN